MFDYVILAAAAFFAGMLNTVAGGGTFLTFPALVYTGVSPVAANATSAVAVFPGYLGGGFGFRQEIAAFDRMRLMKIVASTAIGGLAGSLLLLVTSNDAFSVVVPFLLAAATLAFAFGPRIQAWVSRRSVGKPEGVLGTLLVSVYGGYFNGGLGIVLLALFSLWDMRDLNAMNGLKNALSLVLSGISVVTFAAAGIVAWPQAVLMMVAATIGGYAGAPVARALPASVVRTIVIAVGASMSALFFWRAFA
tara:strand:- start:307 stop:1053 length:747 start_codon:yes stop_codon:yes gene_type:complete